MVNNNIVYEVIEDIEAESVWDEIVRNFFWCNLYQSYQWGEIKKDYGWTPVRAIIKDANGKIILASQTLIKKKYGCLVGWSPGGPLFNKIDDLKAFDLLSQSFFKRKGLIKYLRIYPMIVATKEDIGMLTDSGWKRPQYFFHKSMTILLDINNSLEVTRRQLKQKWRYYLKRSESFDHSFKMLTSLSEFSDFIISHKDMCKTKGLKDTLDFQELKILKEKLNENLCIFTTYNSGSLTAGWVLVRFFDTAYVLRGFTTQRGRELLSSYFCLWEAIKYFTVEGCKHIEMGGIDPDENKGVTHFKRGIGGEEVLWLGEWDQANNNFARILVNSLLCIRK